MEEAKTVPITERLLKIKIGSYTVDEGSHSKHFAVRAVCEEAAQFIEQLQHVGRGLSLLVNEQKEELERLRSERAILRDSAKDVIAWCDANPPADDAFCVARLRHAIVATEMPNAQVIGGDADAPASPVCVQGPDDVT